MFSRIDFSQLKARLKDLGQRIIFPPAAADPEARDEAEFMPSRIAALRSLLARLRAYPNVHWTTPGALLQHAPETTRHGLP